jgi:hypothetical protein
VSAKQDRVYTRTASQLKQELNFGESFAEVMGIATDARRMAEEAEKNAGNPSANLTSEDVFNILTNNGALQGIYRGDDGQIYINASYLRSGVITSADGTIQINLGAGATGPVFNTGISTNGITVRGDEVNAPELLSAGVRTDKAIKYASLNLYDIEGNLLATITEDVSGTGGGLVLKNSSGAMAAIAQATDTSAGFRLLLDSITKAYFAMNSEGVSVLACDEVNCQKIEGRSISWKDNGDGTYTLIGT